MIKRSDLIRSAKQAVRQRLLARTAKKAIYALPAACLAWALPTSVSAQDAYTIQPQQLLYTAPENGSYIIVNYDFTNLSNFPIWIWSTPEGSPAIFSVSGDPTDQAFFLGEASKILFPIVSLKADPGQTLSSFVQYLFQTPDEQDGNDYGTTVYSVFPEMWLTTTPDVLGPFVPGEGSSTGFAITVTDVPELTSWAMMVCGFGLTGAVLRQRRKAVVSFA